VFSEHKSALNLVYFVERRPLCKLRKECGSVIANSMGIFAASRALRHADIRTTSQFYSDKKVRITTGLDSGLTSSLYVEQAVWHNAGRTSYRQSRSDARVHALDNQLAGQRPHA
jgi:hypothetical protein